MKNLIKIIGIIFSILICLNTDKSIAAPVYYYPKEYNITINNINKKDISKIEIITESMEFNEKENIIVDKINKREINETENGISFIVSKTDEGFLYLKIYTKGNKEIFSNDFYKSMIIDEFLFQDKEYVKSVEDFEKEIVYFVGDYNSDNTRITLNETNEQPTIIITSNNNIEIIIIIVVALLVAGILIGIFFKKKKTK